MILGVNVKIFKGFITLVIFGICIGWYSYQNFYPLSEFQRLGQFQFPMGTSAETWSEGETSLTGTFKIDATQSETLVTNLKLEKKEISGKDIFFTERCYNDNKNRLSVEFNPSTAIVKIKIDTPDMAGDKPCL